MVCSYSLKLPTYKTRTQDLEVIALAMVSMMLSVVWNLFICPVTARADSFTDLFHTSAFRGSFAWLDKISFVGVFMQAVISIFCIIGAALIIIRMVTSLLYLSARGLWEEVHELKQGESDKYDFGLINMGQSWVKGKSGTGFDAIIGAFLMLSIDIKKYSDFGDKSGFQFDENITFTGYILKTGIAYVMALFFLACGFNGTLVKAFATSVDALGVIADRAVSINYAGFIEDMVNVGTGYKFTYKALGTEEGKLKEAIASELYAMASRYVDTENDAQVYTIGANIESIIDTNFENEIETLGASVIPAPVFEVIKSSSDGSADKYYANIRYDITDNTNTDTAGFWNIKLSDIFYNTGISGSDYPNNMTFHVKIGYSGGATGSNLFDLPSN